MVSLKTVVVAGIHYLIHPQKLGSITATINPDSILPVTLLTTEEIFSGDLEQLLDGLADVDDVFIPDFGGVLVEKVPPENSTNVVSELKRSPSEVGDRDLYHLDYSVEALNDLVHLPSGPYILHGPNLYQAWRLYDDEYEAFNFGVIPEDVNEPSEFRALNALSPGGVFKSIPVPSRLYHRHPSPEKPLSGVRLSISDTVSLQGTQTTLSSRAWTAVHPDPATSSAEYARRLIELGAVIVGKTKISQFAAGGEWVDASAPWNPRADQYQRPSISSAGAAVAVAGYEWLQHAIGEDAIGGLRSPGASQGVYALRPSFKNDTLDGVQISSPELDTLGLADRSLDELVTISEAILNQTGALNPSRILYITDLVEFPQEQADLVDEFAELLEASTNATMQRTGLSEIWDKSPPPNADGQSLQDYLGQAIFRSFCYEYNTGYQGFRKAYREQFDAEPFAEATTQYRWDVGSNITEEEHTADLDRIKTLQAWGEEHVFGSESRTVVVLPYQASRADYRQDENGSPAAIEVITPELLASTLGVPHLIVPFDQIPFVSKVSGKTEYLPFSVSVMGQSGSDVALVQLVKHALEQGKRPVRVMTGKNAFTVDANL